MILVIDNYDSFTYNLVQYLGTIRPDIQVVRNDQVTLEEIEKWDPSHILLSPGPGYPEEAGICINVVKKFQGKIPILGICLGHQAICQAYGAVIAPAKELMHGKKSLVTLKSDCSLFAGLGVTIEAARYHSLAVKRDTLPDCLKITAQTEDGEVMAVEHKEYPVYGLQFHPESVLTTKGMKILENFVKIERKERKVMIKEAIHT